MKKYFYIARSPTGKKVKGNLQVENENELLDIMVQHNYKLIKCKELKQKKQLFSIFIFNKNKNKLVQKLISAILLIIGVILVRI